MPRQSQPSLPGLILPQGTEPSPGPDLAQVTWVPTRSAGLARLAAFLPAAGRSYAARRNHDPGPGDRSTVSALSPWIRHRLIAESEVVACVLQQHRYDAAEKFIQEVCWRTYWKGWLQLRPAMLVRFDAERRAQQARLRTDPTLAQRVADAQGGRTGIACFDTWARELVTHGWLHNHVRMWFASIWIFTLRLPWQLGADFFYKHLLDADPASNTLSWRWVAGLHTPGKHYLARADNIARHTGGRFDPRGLLDETAPPLPSEGPPPPPVPLPPPGRMPSGPFAWLVTDEDLCLEQDPSHGPALSRARSLAVLDSTAPGPASGPAARFRAGGLADGLTRAAEHCGRPPDGLLDSDGVVAWARSAGVAAVVTAEAGTGLTSWALDGIGARLAANGIPLIRVRRDWDHCAWPRATAGFFRFREAIPGLISGLERS